MDHGHEILKTLKGIHETLEKIARILSRVDDSVSYLELMASTITPSDGDGRVGKNPSNDSGRACWEERW